MAISQSRLDELLEKIFFTFLLLVVYRLAAQIPVVGVNATAIKDYFASGAGGIFDLKYLFRGCSKEIFSPSTRDNALYYDFYYFLSSVKLFLKFKSCRKILKGKKRFKKWTRYANQLFYVVFRLRPSSCIRIFPFARGVPVIPDPGMLFRVTTTITLAAGTMFLSYGLVKG